MVSVCCLTGEAVPLTYNEIKRTLYGVFQIGDTCLHVSSRYNNVKVLKLLLSTLCSVTEQNQVLCVFLLE